MRPPVHHGVPRGRAGFSLLEVLVGMTLLVLILASLYMILGDSSKAIRSKSAVFDTEVEARRVLDRIAMALLSAEYATLDLAPEAPLSSNYLNYHTSLGFRDGLPLSSPPMRILHDSGTRISWAENPGSAGERHAVWTSHAAPFIAGEILNGIDDNGNGVIDERGFSVVKESGMLVIRLTISRPGLDDAFTEKTLETRVTCRN